MATYNELPGLIEPSDVFGAEPSTDAGYARETFTLTLVSGDVVNTGRILVLDYVEKTATLATATTAIGVNAKLGVFYGADLKTNGTGTRINLEADFAKDGATVQVVAITRVTVVVKLAKVTYTWVKRLTLLVSIKTKH